MKTDITRVSFGMPGGNMSNPDSYAEFTIYTKDSVPHILYVLLCGNYIVNAKGVFPEALARRRYETGEIKFNGNVQFVLRVCDGKVVVVNSNDMLPNDDLVDAWNFLNDMYRVGHPVVFSTDVMVSQKNTPVSRSSRFVIIKNGVFAIILYVKEQQVVHGLGYTVERDDKSLRLTNTKIHYGESPSFTFRVDDQGEFDCEDHEFLFYMFCNRFSLSDELCERSNISPSSPVANRHTGLSSPSDDDGSSSSSHDEGRSQKRSRCQSPACESSADGAPATRPPVRSGYYGSWRGAPRTLRRFHGMR